MSSYNTPENSTALNQFLNYKGEDFQKLILIPKEASIRNYYRVIYENQELVLCIDENFKTIPYPFLDIRNFLEENSIPVPKILNYDPNLNAILMNDAGEKDLTSILDDSEYISQLKISLEYILKLQTLNPIPIIADRSFHYEKLMFEVNHTCSGYLRFKEKYKIELDITSEMYAFLQEASGFLAKFEEKVICHRDYHARNILLNIKHEQTIIDFQDMMMGTPQYDLASLVYDAYRPLSIQRREELYSFFKERSQFKNKRFREYYLTQALQRSFKALGTYLVQFNEKQNLKYKESIPKALENLMEICQLGRFPDQLYVFFYLLNKRLTENTLFNES
ncbi:MAG TPA: aminoglycoside phosphotransferase family protein [Leptospiraceae bacterium]|nr:aminoglycoside phosphotransferase family protein [Leptospiraceae bacterium]HMW07422.1 aminoglycoside phosphotransferase family protein [Leptospiraceae bacterium]HMX34684.1 aminoglycoside phosphotransferase family protein [Leptospiraceae bacterium]HMY33001.1 aminoglycoside phosphotransferase family protein [Leptospiraceae bacterium]HMZ63541.1 aminoglycoside phosphotransferase family protein [Leptospiraceae bacterium]